MTIKSESGFDGLELQTGKERDIDIYTLSSINSIINAAPGMLFILTGSYAIEALTGNKMVHNDMDANIFTANIGQDLPRAAVLIDELGGPKNRLHLAKKTADRLEYLTRPNSKQIPPRGLEIQFVESVMVPTILAKLADSSGNEFVFRVKSLPYLIATWAIRISGSAYDPKRPVRDSDLEHLKLLLTGKYNHNDIISAMRHHPQMPKNISEEKVFDQALTVLAGGE